MHSLWTSSRDQRPQLGIVLGAAHQDLVFLGRPARLDRTVALQVGHSMLHSSRMREERVIDGVGVKLQLCGKALDVLVKPWTLRS